MLMKYSYNNIFCFTQNTFKRVTTTTKQRHFEFCMLLYRVQISSNFLLVLLEIRRIYTKIYNLLVITCQPITFCNRGLQEQIREARFLFLQARLFTIAQLLLQVFFRQFCALSEKYFIVSFAPISWLFFLLLLVPIIFLPVEKYFVSQQWFNHFLWEVFYCTQHWSLTSDTRNCKKLQCYSFTLFSLYVVEAGRTVDMQ